MEAEPQAVSTRKVTQSPCLRKKFTYSPSRPLAFSLCISPMAVAGSSESLTTALYMDTAKSTTQLRRLREQVENGWGLDGRGDHAFQKTQRRLKEKT